MCDGARDTWVDRALPLDAVPFAKLARLDKPIGAHLLMWPCFWSAALAADAGAAPDPKHLALFAVGSVLLRGAGCTVNDLWDREIDKKVARTRTRPIASGAVSPLAASAFLGAQLVAGLGVLLQFDDFTRALGASDPYVVLSVGGGDDGYGYGRPKSSARTSTKKNTLNPRWGDDDDGRCVMCARRDPRAQTLTLDVYDEDRLPGKKDDFLGTATVCFADLVEDAIASTLPGFQ